MLILLDKNYNLDTEFTESDAIAGSVQVLLVLLVQYSVTSPCIAILPRRYAHVHKIRYCHIYI